MGKLWGYEEPLLGSRYQKHKDPSGLSILTSPTSMHTHLSSCSTVRSTRGIPTQGGAEVHTDEDHSG